MVQVQKYIDMAYGNSIGRRWLRTLHKPDIWAQWRSRVFDRVSKFEGSNMRTEIKDLKTYPDRIVISAIWHLGYARDATPTETMARGARRLRTPPDGGSGVSMGPAAFTSLDFRTYGMPWEYIALDEFLETVVRPALN